MHKPLDGRVVVITGASSGIGRRTALMCAEEGATVALIARNEVALGEVANEIERNGGKALVIPADVTDWVKIQRAADTTVGTFGRIDAWVNNAGVSIYATAEETTVEEAKRVMETNFLGIVHGVSAVLPYMRQQGYGTIINVGSVESHRALPLQSVYSASKHAVKGYTEALRMEEEIAQSGVDVTLILPSGINTPLFNHARSKVNVKPMPVPPVYSPDLAARAIVSAIKSPQRDIFVGGAGLFFWAVQRINPKLFDKIMTTNKMMVRMQTTDEPTRKVDNLFQSIEGSGRVYGDFENMSKPSLYTPLFEIAPKWIQAIVLSIVPASIITALIYRNRE